MSPVGRIRVPAREGEFPLGCAWEQAAAAGVSRTCSQLATRLRLKLRSAQPNCEQGEETFTSLLQSILYSGCCGKVLGTHGARHPF